MNKIYKVIWSKVKHQYVVVSELAHSSGKQSRTARKSLRSRIAALVVCGAIAAFGMYGALPVQQAFAADGGEATQSQYIAIAVADSNNVEGDERQFDNYNYVRRTVELPNGQFKQYWVRKGYDIVVEQGKHYEGINEGTDYFIDAKKNKDYNEKSDQGLLKAYQTTESTGKITTLTGVNIEDLNTGVYGGATNAGGVDTPDTFGYHIQVGDENNYIKVSNDLDGTGSGKEPGEIGNTNFGTYFSHKITLEDNGTYSFVNGDGETVTVPTNKIYSIGG